MDECKPLPVGCSFLPGSVFLVMELVAGGTLEHALHAPGPDKSSRRKALSWDVDGKHIAADVAAGTNYLHTRSPPVIIRDLKAGRCRLTL